MGSVEGAKPERMWEAIGEAITAHVVMLHGAGILDEPQAAAVLTVVDGIRRGAPPPGPPSDLVASFDDRLDALLVAQAPGAGTLGRSRNETVACAIRLVLRTTLLDLLGAVDLLRLALLDLAADHVFTLLAAFSEGRPLQPTSLAHYLGGIVAPLGRAAAHLRASQTEVNRSPLGALFLASTGLPIDRDGTAQLLAFDGPIVSTFDAVSAVDHLTAAVYPAAGTASAIGRYLADLQLWLRAEPDSVRLSAEWLGSPEPALPHFTPAFGLNRLLSQVRAIESDGGAVSHLLNGIPFGPTGSSLSPAQERVFAILAATHDAAVATTNLITSGIEFNRAALANRASRDHVTTAELAELLVEQEGLDPASARAVAAAVIGSAREHGVEASGITPDLIDAAALATIGREMGIEIERLGSYLAPRRFLERRTALGSPSAAATRDWLELERTKTLADERWRNDRLDHIRKAQSELEREVATLLAGG